MNSTNSLNIIGLTVSNFVASCGGLTVLFSHDVQANEIIWAMRHPFGVAALLLNFNMV